MWKPANKHGLYLRLRNDATYLQSQVLKGFAQVLEEETDINAQYTYKMGPRMLADIDNGAKKLAEFVRAQPKDKLKDNENTWKKPSINSGNLRLLLQMKLYNTNKDLKNTVEYFMADG